MSIGEKIKKHRKLKGLTLKKLSELSGVSMSYLYSLETNKSKFPSISIVKNISNTLDITIEYLIGSESLDKEKVILNKFKLLSEKDKNRINKILDILLNN